MKAGSREARGTVHARAADEDADPRLRGQRRPPGLEGTSLGSSGGTGLSILGSCPSSGLLTPHMFLEHPQRAPTSFQTGQHPPTSKHCFSFFFLPELFLLLRSKCKLLLSLPSRAMETAASPGSLPRFLGSHVISLFTAFILFYLVYCCGLYHFLFFSLNSGGRDHTLFIFESPKGPTDHNAITEVKVRTN